MFLLVVLAGCTPTSYEKAHALANVNGSISSYEAASQYGNGVSSKKAASEGSKEKRLVSSRSAEGLDIPPDLVIPDRSVLIALNRLFGTALGIITPYQTEVTWISSPRLIENVQLSRSEGRLVSYLVIEGLNPGNNYIEIVNLTTRNTQKVKARDGFAIAGYFLETEGKRIVFTEVGLQGTSSRQASWHLSTANLETGMVKEILGSQTPQAPEETLFIPFAWSDQTPEIFLYGTRPFSGGWGKGIWTIQLDGSGLRQLLPESRYTVLPLLSPDGLQLAYLASDMESLPTKYIAGSGAPPGNVLMIRDLRTGAERAIIRIAEQTFNAMAWSLDNEKLILSRQEWYGNHLQDTGVISISVKTHLTEELTALPPLASINSIMDYGQDGAIIWVNKHQKGSDLVFIKKSSTPAIILSVPDGQINMVGYLK